MIGILSISVNHFISKHIKLDGDVIVVSRKEDPKVKRGFPKHISNKEIEKVARVGESYDQVRDRLKELRKATKGK